MQGDPFLRAKMTVLAFLIVAVFFLTLNYRCERETLTQYLHRARQTLFAFVMAVNLQRGGERERQMTKIETALRV